MIETIFIWTGFITLELVMCTVVMLCVASARTLIETVLGMISTFFFVVRIDSKLTYEERKFISDTIKKYR